MVILFFAVFIFTSSYCQKLDSDLYSLNIFLNNLSKYKLDSKSVDLNKKEASKPGTKSKMPLPEIPKKELKVKISPKINPSKKGPKIKISKKLVTQEPKKIKELLDFESWYSSCRANLVPNIYLKEDFEKYERYIAKDLKKDLTLTLEELELALDKFFATQKNGEMAQEKNWVNDYPDAKSEFWNISKEKIFKPFVAKELVSPNTIIALRGDLHGDIHSLLKYLRFLQDNNYLDPQNGFKILAPNFYIIFLGDYVDRGFYGTEVIYTLLRLKIENPDKVILIRGNHEDIGICSKYGFQEEFEIKFGKLEKIVEVKEKSVYKKTKIGEAFDKIIRFYDFLPVALYLGAHDSKNNINNYVQCCHGGMELGFNARLLLDCPSNSCFTWLSELKSADQLNKIDNKIKPEFIKVKDSCPEKNKKKDPMCSFSNFYPKNFYRIGFMWNDFHVDPEQNLSYNPDRGLIYSRRATRAVLNISSSKENIVRGVFRAHQHSEIRTDMMNDLLDKDNVHPLHKGLSLLWQDLQAWEGKTFYDKENDIKLWNNFVCTFLVAPDTNYSQKYYKDIFTYDAFAILKMAENFQDWRLNIYRKNLYDTIVSTQRALSWFT